MKEAGKSKALFWGLSVGSAGLANIKRGWDGKEFTVFKGEEKER